VLPRLEIDRIQAILAARGGRGQGGGAFAAPGGGWKPPRSPGRKFLTY
jgi:hypothetical protein